MSLYIALFKDSGEDLEIDGVEVGPLEDFNAFRMAVAQECFDGDWGGGFPLLLGIRDVGPGWSPGDLPALLSELEEIRLAFVLASPTDHDAGSWQRQLQTSLGLQPKNLHESWFDIDGEPLLDRLISLAKQAMAAQQPLEFT